VPSRERKGGQARYLAYVSSYPSGHPAEVPTVELRGFRADAALVKTGERLPKPVRLLSIISGALYGGAHNQAARLAKPLAEHGYVTRVLLPDEPGNAAERLEQSAVAVSMAPLRRPRAAASWKDNIATVARARDEVQTLRLAMRAEATDLVQIHGLNLYGAIAARAEGLPVVWQLLDTRPPLALRTAMMPAVRFFADVVMTTGLTVAAAYPGALRLGRRLVPYIPPVDVDEFEPRPRLRSAVRAALGVPDGAVLVGSIGNRNPQKGHEYLLRAAPVARTQDERIVVRIRGERSMGHPEYEDLLQRELATSGLEASALGSTGDDFTIPQIMSAFDVFVLSSVRRSEGLPTVLLEAMACEVPIIATDVGGVDEIVTEGETGRVVPAEDVPALAAAMVDLAQNKDLRTAMGREGRRRAIAHWQSTRCADTHIHAYETASIVHDERRRRRRRVLRRG
jgi:glycosyltransferase involved in cell wall biosynthesis